MTTAAAKLRAAKARGPQRTEIRDGREYRVFVLDEATREDMGHRPTAIDTAIARQELDRRGLMRDGSGRHVDSGGPEALRNPFMHVVSAGGSNGGGLVAHRGVLQEDEYVNAALLRKAVEAELGYSYDQVRSVYRQGPLSAAKREIRDVIDARMLALRRSGANMAELGRALGFPIKVSGNCAVLDAAVSRARAVEAWELNLALDEKKDDDEIEAARLR